MTMPTLINQTNGAQYKAAFKKSLSAISQAVTLNVALDDISFADTIRGTAGSTAAPANGVSVASLLNSRMNIVDAKSSAGYDISNTTIMTIFVPKCRVEGQTLEDCTDIIYESQQVGLSEYFDTFLFFNDGSMFAFKNNTTKACTASASCIGLIDVNGAKGPNKETTCTQIPGQEKCQSGTLKMGDIFAVYFYDQRILPASPASNEVLFGK